ncbi:hypothetical protein BJX66DRAFT_345064 [Aspergillus keveii]|uniref:BZIP domain-containing protein n=1 Tax=Aspergillus keveii TaxID=714993 RepID=A0ABR4FJ61_9EURO
MSCCTSFYPAGPLGDLDATPSSLLLSNGFNPEFSNLALLDKGTHRDIPMPSQPSNSPERTPFKPPSMQTKTTRPRIRNRQLLSASQTNRERFLEDEINRAMPFFQYPSYTNFSNKHNHNHSPDQDFGFDKARSHHSDVSNSSKSSPTRHSFWRDEVRKREKHLERNRTAASKSRQKKKHEIDQLKTRFDKVSRKKQLLEEEIKILHSDLLYLKDQILMHSQCDDEDIHSYLERRHQRRRTAKNGEEQISDELAKTKDNLGRRIPVAEEAVEANKTCVDRAYPQTKLLSQHHPKSRQNPSRYLKSLQL